MCCRTLGEVMETSTELKSADFQNCTQNVIVLRAVSSGVSAQTVHTHTHTLRLYRRCCDITEYTALQNCTQRQSMKLQLEWV